MLCIIDIMQIPYKRLWYDAEEKKAESLWLIDLWPPPTTVVKYPDVW